MAGKWAGDRPVHRDGQMGATGKGCLFPPVAAPEASGETGAAAGGHGSVVEDPPDVLPRTADDLRSAATAAGGQRWRRRRRDSGGGRAGFNCSFGSSRCCSC